MYDGSSVRLLLLVFLLDISCVPRLTPRAWGHPSHPPVKPYKYRFTPTCVGTSFSACSWLYSYSVHPHVRGDIDIRDEHGIVETGSPPRAWGHQPLPVLVGYPHRFTPTCVGTSTTDLTPGAWLSVHPHVRGDIFLKRLRHRSPRGSPPRAWGHPLASSRSTTIFSVHPHVRGDIVDAVVFVGVVVGSPPRAWGHPQTSYPSVTSFPVHPHVRGDITGYRFNIGVFGRVRPSKSTMVLGVSPRVRMRQPCSFASG